MIKGDFALSLSSWYYQLDRNPLMDFSIFTWDNMVLILTPQPPQVDLELFTRPFTKDAWLSLAVMVAVLLTAMALPYTLFPSYLESTTAFRIIYFSTMGFFILINAFYGGAMTMFFTSDIRIPLETITDVMRDSTWRLIVQEGEQKQQNKKI